MRATIIIDGRDEQVTGRSVESIARTRFGRQVEIRRVPSPEFDPQVVEWQVVESASPEGNVWRVLGRIVTTERGPGRPMVHGERVMVPVRMTAAQRDAARARAAEAGLPLNAWVIRQLALDA